MTALLLDCDNVVQSDTELHGTPELLALSVKVYGSRKTRETLAVRAHLACLSLRNMERKNITAE